MCYICCRFWCSRNDLTDDLEGARAHCDGRRARAQNLSDRGVRHFRRISGAFTCKSLTKSWAATKQEVQLFDRTFLQLKKQLGRQPKKTKTAERAALRKARRDQKSLALRQHVRDDQRAKVVREGKEPNPGLLRASTVNINGSNHFWSMLATLPSLRERTDTIAFQEGGLYGADRAAAAARAEALGYKLFVPDLLRVEENEFEVLAGLSEEPSLQLPMTRTMLRMARSTRSSYTAPSGYLRGEDPPPFMMLTFATSWTASSWLQEPEG